MDVDPKETPRERHDRLEAEKAIAREASLKRLLEYNHRAPRADTTMTPWKGGLSFDESGAAKLAAIAGFLQGLCMSAALGDLEALAAVGGPSMSPRELAVTLAVSLDKELSYLAGHGGDQEFEVEAATEDHPAQVVKVQARRVMLYDSGEFGGFNVLWLRPYTDEQVHKAARDHDEESFQGRDANGKEIDPDEARARWSRALEEGARDLKLRDGVEERRTWTPSWVAKKREAYRAKHKSEGHEGYSIYSCKRCDLYPGELLASVFHARYGYSMSGGLGLHGFVDGTSSIDVAMGEEPQWRVHT
jgi:hypothetical protein